MMHLRARKQHHRNLSPLKSFRNGDMRAGFLESQVDRLM
jgi:hypothetical protein